MHRVREITITSRNDLKKYKKYWENGDRHEKTVIHFMTNGGWPGHIIRDIKASCPHADFACDMQVKFDFSFFNNDIFRALQSGK